jgi:hypothetical protein
MKQTNFTHPREIGFFLERAHGHSRGICGRRFQRGVSGVVDGRHVGTLQQPPLFLGGVKVAEPLSDLCSLIPITVPVIPDVKSVWASNNCAGLLSESLPFAAVKNFQKGSLGHWKNDGISELSDQALFVTPACYWF